MKRFKETIKTHITKEKAKSIAKKAAPFMMIAVALVLCAAPSTLAAGPNLTKLIKSIITIIENIFIIVGVIFTAYGVGALVMAFKNEDGDSKHRAAMQLGVGVALISISALEKALNLTQYIRNF